MAEHLSPLDAMFLELEQADESAHMHIGAVMVFQAPRGARPPTLEDVQAHLEARLGTLPRYRQRLSSPRTGGLTWPSWEAVEGFELADHVRRARLPAPGRRCRAARVGERLLLAPARPHAAAVGGGARRGHAARTLGPRHEDAITASSTGSARSTWATCMLDARAPHRAGPRRAPNPPPAARLRRADDDASPWWLSPGVLLRGARAGSDARATRSDTLERGRAMVELLVRDELIAAPHTSLNEPIGGTRRLEAVRVPLAELKGIKHGLGGTVNDVVLALCTGGLRRLLHRPRRGAARARACAGRSRSTSVTPRGAARAGQPPHARCSCTCPSPRRTRARATSARSRRRSRCKHGDQALGSRTLVELTSLAPPVLHTVLAQSLFDARLFNLTITNVPGPQRPSTPRTRALVEVLPLVPLFARHAVGIAVVSYDGEVVFGLNADRDGVPDLEVLTAGIKAELADLRALVHERPTTPAGSAS